MRAAWTAAELLTSYQGDTASFELIPGGAGEFELTIDGHSAYSKKATGRYPELNELKQTVVQAIEARAAAPAG